MLAWLRGKLGDLRLRISGPGEITAPDGQANSLIACTHRYSNGTSAWGPCRKYGAGDSTYYSTCALCNSTVRC